MLDINLFREEKGGNPEKIRECLRRCFANTHLVDEVIEFDKVWRQRRFELDGSRTDGNRISKEIAGLKISGRDASAMILYAEENRELTRKKEAEVREALAARQSRLSMIRNLVHDSVPVSNDEANNDIIGWWGEKTVVPKLKNHLELVELLGILDTEEGANVAGGGNFFSKGDGLLLQRALIKFGLDFLENRGFAKLSPPSFMTKDAMAKCAQLAQFDEKLYKVTGEGDDKYLIATAEHPLCAYRRGDWIHPSELPLRYAGNASCFRIEAGSHGRDTLDIFHLPQYEVVEQCCITGPNGNDSWEMLEEMITNCKDFCKTLKVPYQVVSIVSGALNDAAAKTYGVEAWFPASQTYRELASCSNCTDYLPRRLETRYGQKKGNDQAKEYVHILNSTLTAIERTLCCILENYQKEDGVEIPECLRKYMGGKTFIHFKNNPVKEMTNGKNQTKEIHGSISWDVTNTLDINLFHEEKGGNLEKIRESQRRRFVNDHLVDEVIELDKVGMQRQIELDGLRTDLKRTSEEIEQLEISGQDASAMISSAEENRELIIKKEAEVQEALLALKCGLSMIGNLVHDSVPVSNDEIDNVIIRTWGEKRIEPNLKNHVELIELLDIVDTKKGAYVAGGRGYYLKGDGVDLNQALIDFGLDFLKKRGFTPMGMPFMMRKDVMAKCAQLAQFDEELYKVTGDGEDKYLIATAEQALCAYHIDKWIHPSKLPLRYAGFSKCFRKEAGSHGRDTLGIFRTHEFEKVEQFCITSPNGNDSWEMHEEMIKNSEDLYKMLKIPYRVVSVVSGALNDAAAKKYDLEAWFPASQTYRELVSCSNCTDYQSRRLGIRYGQKDNDKVEYVHMLNSTLTATERTMCCILENYQTEDGVVIPECLREYMVGKAFMPFKNKPVKKVTKGKNKTN